MRGFGAGPGAPGQTRNVAAGGYPSQSNPGGKGSPSPAPLTQPVAQDPGQPFNPSDIVNNVMGPSTTNVGFGQELAQASAENPNAFGQSAAQNWVNTDAMKSAGSSIPQYASGLGQTQDAVVQEDAQDSKGDLSSTSYIRNDGEDDTGGNNTGGNETYQDKRDAARAREDAMLAERGLTRGVPSRPSADWTPEEVTKISQNTESMYRAMYDWWTGPREEAHARLRAGEISTGEFQNIIGRALFDLTAHYGYDHRYAIGIPGEQPSMGWHGRGMPMARSNDATVYWNGYQFQPMGRIDPGAAGFEWMQDPNNQHLVAMMHGQMPRVEGWS